MTGKYVRNMTGKYVKNMSGKYVRNMTGNYVKNMRGNSRRKMAGNDLFPVKTFYSQGKLGKKQILKMWHKIVLEHLRQPL